MLEHGINPPVIQFLAGWTSLLERYGTSATPRFDAR